MSTAAEQADNAPITVQILDKDYRIACGPDEHHSLMDCARMLDARMREVRQNGRVIGADRIAVMAALNLLYELTQKMGNVSTGSADGKRLGKLLRRVERAIAASEPPPTAGLDLEKDSV